MWTAAWALLYSVGYVALLLADVVVVCAAVFTLVPWATMEASLALDALDREDWGTPRRRAEYWAAMGRMLRAFALLTLVLLGCCALFVWMTRGY